MNCEQTIKKAIQSACAKTAAGLDNGKIYIFPKSAIELGFQVGSKIAYKLNDSLTASGYVGTFSKKMFNAGFERVISDDQPDSFAQTVSIVGVEFGEESRVNFDELGNVVVVVERKGADGEGKFIILGAETGLYVSADSWSANDGGVRNITLSTLDGEGASQSYIILDCDFDGENVPTSVGGTATQIRSYLDKLTARE